MKNGGKQLGLLAVALAAWWAFGPAPEARASLLTLFPFEEAANPGDTVSDVSGSPSVQVGTLMDDAHVAGGALRLDGSGDYLRFGDEGELESLGAMTLTARVRAAAPVGGSLWRIVEHEDVFYFWAQGDRFRYTTHGTTSQAVSTTAVTPGTWQQVTAVYRSGRPAEIYVDGVLEGTSGANQPAMNDSAHPFQIGARRGGGGSPSNFWNGDMDDVAIWDEALSQGHIQELAGRTASGLLIHSTMDDAHVNRSGVYPPPPLSTADNGGGSPAGDWTVEDLAGSAEHGTAISVNTGGTVDSSAPGVLGQAISFSSTKGGNRRVQYGDVHDLTPGHSQTISLWFKSDTPDQLDFIACKGNRSSGNVGWSIWEDGAGSGRLQLRAYNGTQKVGLYHNFTGAEAGTWHHVAFVIDNQTGKVFGYLDGLGSGTWGTDNGWAVGGGGAGAFTFTPDSDFSNTNRLLLGLRDDEREEWDGDLDDFALWDTALTPSKVMALVNLAQSPLAYNAGVANGLFQLFDARSGGVLGGQTWHYTTGLQGAPGDVLRVGGNMYAVILDAAGNGLTSVPEPGTLSLLALGGAGMLLRRRRRRRGARGTSVALGAALLLALGGGALAGPIPPPTASLLVHLQGDKGVTTSGSEVTTWADQGTAVGGANTATNAGGAGTGPALVSGGIGGLPTVRFDGTTWLEVGSHAAFDTDEFTWFLVAKSRLFPAAAENLMRTAYASGAGGNSDRMWSTFTQSGSYYSHARTSGGGFVGSGASASTAPLVVSARWAGDNAVTEWLDGAPAGTNTGATANPSGHVRTAIGRSARFSEGSFFDGDLSEILIYNTTLSTIQRRTAEDYLYDKYFRGGGGGGGGFRANVRLHATLDTAHVSGTTVQDTAGTPQNGSIVGAVPGATGQINQALQFNGSDSNYVSFGDVLDPGADSYTASVWFRPTDTSGTEMIVGKGNSYSSHVGWTIWSSGDDLYVRGCDNSGNRFAQVLADALAPDTWYHAALVIDRDQDVILGYLNGTHAGWAAPTSGVPTTDLVPPGTTIDTSDWLILGRRWRAGTPFSGLADDLVIWDRALSRMEIRALYDLGLGGASYTLYPEPGTLSLLALGGAGMLIRRRARRA